MRYRKEIDGLRAIAVVPVMLFHAGFTRLAGGGFVGVDIFFVISGFLITSIILEERTKGTFTYAGFYERRARRILPALYFVLLACIPFAFAWMLPDEFTRFSRTFFSVLLFSSNTYLWLNSNYFSPDTDFDPLLHTWSLAVEEQYYLLFPAVILLAWRLGFRGLLSVLLVGTLGSLILAEIGWRHWPTGAFFLLPTRAWELGLGSLVALYLFRRPKARIAPVLANLASSLGLGMIVLSIVLFDANTPFPGVYALVPTLGAALIILFADSGTIVGRLLALRPVVFIGLISYSAYLWHQPLFAFARIRSLSIPDKPMMLTLVALTILLAWLTWRYVERPFRDRSLIPSRHILRIGGGASLAMIAIAITSTQAHLFRIERPDHLRQFYDVTLEQRYEYVNGSYNARAADHFVEDGRKKLLLIGDSFSQDLFNLIQETGAFPKYQIAASFYHPSCQIYLGSEDVRPFMAPERRAECTDADRRQHMLDLAAQADVVLFAFRWREWAAERLAATIQNFGFRPDQRVVVIGRKDFGNFNMRAFSSLPAEALPSIRSVPEGDAVATNEILRKTFPPPMFVDIQRHICGDKTDCPLFTPAGELISHDGFHLTRAGARYVGARLFQDPGLRGYLSPGDGRADRRDASGSPVRTE